MLQQRLQLRDTQLAAWHEQACLQDCQRVVPGAGIGGGIQNALRCLQAKELELQLQYRRVGDNTQ